MNNVELGLRKILEKISRNLIFKRKLSQRFAYTPLLVSPGSSLKYWRFDLEKIDPMLLNIAHKYLKPGDVIWDIGSNNGLFTFAAASQVRSSGKVLAIEADTWLVNLLKQSTKLTENKNLNIDVLGVAIAEQIALEQLNLAQQGRATNYLNTVTGSTQTGGIINVDLVMTITLDWLMEKYSHPNFIKIDVEGAEKKVIAGAEKLLAQVKPLILCEISQSNKDYFNKTLTSLNYVFYDAETVTDNPVSIPEPTYNTLAIPQDKILELHQDYQ